MPKIFAEGYALTEEGHPKFPRDLDYRKANFFVIPKAEKGESDFDSLDHEAKANLYLVESLFEYLTEPGDSVLDITAGTGSLLLAARAGRHVSMIEINSMLIDIIEKSARKMGITYGTSPGQYLIYNGACQDFLPFENQVDSIIFSPPYARAMQNKGGLVDRDARKKANQVLYTQGGKQNLGNLENFYYNRLMRDIYDKCFKTLKPGGTLALIIKDRMEHGKIISLSGSAVRSLYAAGFVQQDWFRWKPPGQVFLQIHKLHGHKVMEYEELIIMVKPNE